PKMAKCSTRTHLRRCCISPVEPLHISAMNKFFFTLLCVSGLLLVRTVSSADATREASAQDAAEKWLALVDAGKYTESWEAMSAPFKKEVSKRKWKPTIEEIRRPLGKRDSRKLK